jgi:predicted ABC-type transport system involved in lysophospholipase L1 biosynthesis ATPase subunit
MSNRKGALIALRGVTKMHRKGGEVIRALDGIDLEVAEKGMVAIVGASGSGKSSLLHVVGAMDRPSAGEVRVAGQDLNRLPEAALTRFRRQTVGFVFQAFNLIPNLTAVENVMLPMEFNAIAGPERRRRAAGLLERVDLGKRLAHRPREMSGGEPLTSGFAGAALLTFASFAAAMGLMMLLTSVLVGLAKASLLRRLQASTVWIKRASGAVLIVAGLYLGYYYVLAGM